MFDLSFRPQDTWARRRVQLGELDVMRMQSASGAVSITRNDELLPRTATHEAFRYRTPEIAFGEPLTPLLEFDDGFDVSKLSADPVSLAKHFEALFGALFVSAGQEKRRLEIEGMYRFNLNAAGGTVIGRRRIFLRTSFIFVPATDTRTLAGQLAARFDAWGSRNQPAKTGAFGLRLTVFASLGLRTRVPIYRAKDLFVPLEKIT